MAKLPNFRFDPSILSLAFSLLIILLPDHISASPSFTPTDNYLINCGSNSPSTTDIDNRKFIGDEWFSSDSVSLSATRTTSIRGSNLSGVSSPVYFSARIFTKPSSYAFRIKEKGAHLVRLHFHRFNSPKFGLSNAQFHVLADGYLLLNNFDAFTMKNVEIREYIFCVDSDKLEISFIPSKKSKFGFISAIEVISAPKDLILDLAQKVDSSGVVKINGFSKNGFETLYRVNVGGPKVTPFNDSLWRTWVPDHGFLEPSGESKEVHFSGRIKYQSGGASREVAPDNVYDSARVIVASDSNIPKYNLTWAFPVVDGFKYLVRTHFCDIASAVLGSLYFNVYVNGNLAYENLDLSTITNSLASPFYADFVVDGGDNGVLMVSIGPSNWSSASGVDAILNGVEVFKLSNSVHSFDGLISGESILRKCRGGSGGLLVPLAAAMGLLVAASLILRKRFMGIHDSSVRWSRLPTDVSEVDLKSGY